MTEIAEKIRREAETGDVRAYYGAVYEFSAVSLSAERNAIRRRMILDLLPAVRRIHFLALLRQTRDLKENARYFQLLVRHMNRRDPDGGEKVIRKYLESEKKIALDSLGGEGMMRSPLP